MCVLNDSDMQNDARECASRIVCVHGRSWRFSKEPELARAREELNPQRRD